MKISAKNFENILGPIRNECNDWSDCDIMGASEAEGELEMISDADDWLEPRESKKRIAPGSLVRPRQWTKAAGRIGVVLERTAERFAPPGYDNEGPTYMLYNVLVDDTVYQLIYDDLEVVRNASF